ncbi:MAG: hypothetical protein HKM95_01820 [Inquilinus sp.]|nr:hypothetical protein [Inquilinus sp.]
MVKPDKAAKATNKAAGKAKRSNAASLVLWVMVAIIGLAFFALPTLIVTVALLVPTIVAAIVDRSREHHAMLAVGSLNLAGLVPALLNLWAGGHTIGGAGRVLADPYAWLAGFGAAGVGWLLVLGLPKLLELAMTLRNEAEIRRLQERQTALVAEWGPDVAGKQDSETAAAAE